ncbi:MAG: GNAT family N-acetyltransferase [Anaerolineae bacterium]|nr:GNAT family N-acetyltransferase [Anaerolineae bacterium]
MFSPNSPAYFLTTPRLGFRYWTPEDTALAIGLWGDPAVTKLIGGPFSADQVMARLHKEIATQHDHSLQYWPIFALANGDHIGCCGLRPYQPQAKICEIGFHLRSAFWGQGYAAEAARAVIDYAFTNLGCEALFAGHNPANDASRRLLIKLGFRYTHDEFYSPTGLNHPSYLLTKPAG